MQAMFRAANTDSINRKIADNSGCVSCCTCLYNSGIDDKAIMSCSGQHSDTVISGCLLNNKCLSV